MRPKDNEGYFMEFECPICNKQMRVRAITCDENPNYSEFNCSKHGLVKVYPDGHAITLFDELKENCIEYIRLLNFGDTSIYRVEIHEKIANALGLNHANIALAKITDNLDECIALPLNREADPIRYGERLYKLLIEKFADKSK